MSVQSLSRSQELCHKGVHKAQMGDLPLAISFFEEALQIDPSMLETRLKLAQSLTYHGDYLAANDHYIQLLNHMIEHHQLQSDLLLTINSFRHSYRKHLPQDRLNILLCHPHESHALHTHPLMALGDVQTLSPLHKNWHSPWKPDIMIAVGLETCYIPRNIDDIDCLKIGFIQNTHPYMERLARDIQHMDILIVTNPKDKDLCQKLTQAPIYVCPINPCVDPSRPKDPLEWEERTIDAICLISPSPHNALTHSFLQIIQDLKEQYRIVTVDSITTHFENVIAHARLMIYFHDNSTQTFLHSAIHSSLKHNTLVLSSINLLEKLNWPSKLPIHHFRLDNLYNQVQALLNTQGPNKQEQHDTHTLLHKVWSPYAIWDSILKTVKKTTYERPKPSTSIDHRLQSEALLGQMSSFPSQDHSKALVNNFYTRWQRHPYSMIHGHNFVFMLGQHLYRYKTCPHFPDQQVHKIFKTLLKQDSLHPLVLHNKIQIMQQLNQSLDIPSLKNLEQALNLRYGEHYFFEDYLLALPEDFFIQWAFSSLREHQRQMSNEDFVVAYRSLIAYTTYTHLGKYALQRSLLTQAEMYFEQAAQAQPKACQPQLKLALIKLKQKDIVQARYRAQQALWNDASNPHAQFILESTSQQQQDSEALAHLIQNGI